MKLTRNYNGPKETTWKRKTGCADHWEGNGTAGIVGYAHDMEFVLNNRKDDVSEGDCDNDKIFDRASQPLGKPRRRRPEFNYDETEALEVTKS